MDAGVAGDGQAAGPRAGDRHVPADVGRAVVRVMVPPTPVRSIVCGAAGSASAAVMAARSEPGAAVGGVGDRVHGRHDPLFQRLHQ